KDFALTDIFKKLEKFDRQGGFSGMEYPQSLWYGVLYDPNKKRVQVVEKYFPDIEALQWHRYNIFQP
ncbi:MAG: hypothetical protein ACKPDM_12710, partial [Dolichospermum sp.]